MEHDFSEIKKKELLEQLKAVENEEQSIIMDALGDIWSTCMFWLGILSIDNYVNNVSEYHRKIIDQKDMQKKELEKIFDNVSNVDKEYGIEFGCLTDALSEYKNSISQLAALMQVDKASFTSNYIKQAGKSVIVSLNKGLETYKKVFDKELSKAEKRIIREELKDATVDLLSFVGDMAGFAYNVATGDVKGVLASGWNTIDTFVSFLSDLGAIESIALGRLFNARTTGLRKAKEAQKQDSIAGVFEESGCNELASMAKGVDLAADAYGLFEAGKDIVDSVGKAESIFKKSDYNLKTKIVKYTEMGIGELGFGDPFKSAQDTETFAQYIIKYDKTKISNLKTLVGYGVAVGEEEVVKKIFGKLGISGFASDFHDFLDDAEKFLTKDIGFRMEDLMCVFN